MSKIYWVEKNLQTMNQVVINVILIILSLVSMAQEEQKYSQYHKWEKQNTINGFYPDIQLYSLPHDFPYLDHNKKKVIDLTTSEYIIIPNLIIVVGKFEKKKNDHQQYISKISFYQHRKKSLIKTLFPAGYHSNQINNRDLLLNTEIQVYVNDNWRPLVRTNIDTSKIRKIKLKKGQRMTFDWNINHLVGGELTLLARLKYDNQKTYYSNEFEVYLSQEQFDSAREFFNWEE